MDSLNTQMYRRMFFDKSQLTIIINGNLIDITDCLCV